MSEKPSVMMTGEVARLLSVSPDWVRTLVKRGVLSAQISETGRRIFNREDVERLARAREAGA